LGNAITHPRTVYVKEHVGDVTDVLRLCKNFPAEIIAEPQHLPISRKERIHPVEFFGEERMRLAFIIVCLTSIGVGLVHIRRQEVALRHEVQSKQSRHIVLRREIWEIGRAHV